MANEKVWLQEQRDAAAEKLSSRQAGDDGRLVFYANGYSHKTWAVDLQCELTAKDAELAEAVELLRNSQPCGLKNVHHDAAWFDKREAWLKRNTPQEASNERG